MFYICFSRPEDLENDWTRIECNVTTCPPNNDIQQLAINASLELQETFGDTILIGGSFTDSGTDGFLASVNFNLAPGVQ